MANLDNAYSPLLSSASREEPSFMPTQEMKEAFQKAFLMSFENAGLHFSHEKDGVISYFTYKVASPYLNLVVRDKDYAYHVPTGKWMLPLAKNDTCARDT